MAPVNDPNVGVAFGLVVGAGLSTAVGAAVVFFPSLVKLASRRVLAGALGISAGVMIYVSFAEIFVKSQDSFAEAGFAEDRAYIYATLCFFAGVVVMLLMDICVKALSGGHHHHHDDGQDHQNNDEDNNVNSAATNDDNANRTLVCCSPDPAGDLETIQRQAAELTGAEPAQGEQTDEEGDPELKKTAAAQENTKLVRMGVSTALAIGLHNFPEGLATFVGALDDPSVGAVLAIAVGIHNIPEGLCVALPIYYATGNRWKAFGWAMVSGASEPIAALLGWAVLANSFSDTLYAVLFGLVAGMMVIISARELIPTAHRYDPEDTVVTYSVIIGMAIMAISLVLFVI